MHPFALLAEQAEELHRCGLSPAEPVRDAGVELGDLVLARVVDTDGVDLVCEPLLTLPLPDTSAVRR